MSETKARRERRKWHAKACPRKQAFPALTDALTQLRWLRETGDIPDSGGAYRCLACRAYHITHNLRPPA